MTVHMHFAHVCFHTLLAVSCTDHTGAVTFSPLEEQLITVAHLSSLLIMFYLPVGHLWVGRKGKSQPAVSLQR